ncbi:MAG: DUF3108 domain-containing protein [Calditrichaeota bacterium]|nr:MAG: DUF3108 domain-containing protein [Calditrichota bacterium]
MIFFASRFVFFSLFLFLPSALSSAQSIDNENQNTIFATNETTKVASDSNEGVIPPLRIIDNKAFEVGEHLLFNIRYGPIVAGKSSMSIPELVDMNGHPSYHIQTKAWSNKFFSRFFKVEDQADSYIDQRGIFSWKFEKRIREGHYKKDTKFIYDQYKNLAYTPKDTLEVQPFVQDVLSALYFIRTQDFEPGDTLKVENQSDSKVYPLNVIIHKRETVKVKAGKFKCIVVEPVLRGEGLFKAKGRIIVHMTDDEKKVPVLMTTKIYIKAFSLGEIVAELEKIEGVPGY